MVTHTLWEGGTQGNELRPEALAELSKEAFSLGATQVLVSYDGGTTYGYVTVAKVADGTLWLVVP